jgi:oligopeptide transport system permease protein
MSAQVRAVPDVRGLRSAATPASRLAGAGLLLLFLYALAGPWLVQAGYADLDWQHMGSPPALDTGHWFGTDRIGRDLFVRTAQGLRVSLGIGLLAALATLLFGVVYGVLAGFAGGRLDAWMMRTVDVLYSLPYLFFIIVLTLLIDQRVIAVFAGVAAVGWLTMARIVRGEADRLTHRDFIAAATVLGLPRHRIVLRHVLPNLLGPVIAYATLALPQLILVEGFLSYLGLGIQEPHPSLGSLLAEGTADMEFAPWMLLAPGACLALLVLCLNVLGDALCDALDPRRR